MQISVHATVQQQGEKLLPKLGNPSDHQLEGDFHSMTIEEAQLQLQVVLWSQSALNPVQTQEAVAWVMSCLGFAV